MDITAQAIFNNAIVKIERETVVIDNNPQSTDIIKILQNFGLAPDNWYLEIGAFNLHFLLILVR